MSQNENSLASRQNAAPRWFALRVRARAEKTVAYMSHNKGFPTYLPVYPSRRRWSDRYKTVELPLFPGYVFCQLDPEHRMPLLTIPGVMNFVGIGRAPVAIEDSELEAVQKMLAFGAEAGPWPYLAAGERVRVDYGPLAGIEGIYVETRKEQRIVVSVNLLQRSVAAEIDRDWVTPVGSRRLLPSFEQIGCCTARA